MQPCICDVTAWATVNMHRLNDNISELKLVTSERNKLLHELPTSLDVDNAKFSIKQFLRNLGLALACDLNRNTHVA